MKKGFVFDLDGVLTDTAAYHYLAWKNLAEKIGISIDLTFNEQLKGISRMDSLERILVYGGKENAYTQEQKEKLAEEKNTEYVKELHNLSPADLLPGVASFLQEARDKQVPCSLASASKNAPYVLEKLEISDFFVGIVDPNSLKKGKPDPEIFIKAAEILGIQPEEAVGFEDAPAGIEGIKGAGMFAVGVMSDEPLPEADITVRRLDELSVEELLDR